MDTNEYAENFKFTDIFGQWGTGSFDMDLIANYNYGTTVGAAALCAYSDNFLILKHHACLQVWSIREKRLINRVTAFSTEKVFYKQINSL